MKRIAIVVLIVLSCFGLSAKQDITISLITADQGEYLYEAFGHSAIRVQIPEANYDCIYNYGSFDFNQPNFYLNFCRGRLNYALRKTSFQSFLYAYDNYGRTLTEQIMLLDSAQAVQVLSFLEWNAKEENCNYRYHFFDDNCATRIRDIFAKLYGSQTLNPDAIGEGKSFRQWVHYYGEEHSWGVLGIDIALGARTDSIANRFGEMFLPDLMRAEFSRALYNGKPIVTKTHAVNNPANPLVVKDTWLTPMVVAIALLVIALLLAFRKHSIVHKIFDTTIFTISGLLGILIIFLWFFTDHTNTQANWNLIWALPTHLFAAVLIARKQPPHFMKYYCLVTACLTMLLVITSPIIPQQLNAALYPYLLAQALRSFAGYRRIR